MNERLHARVTGMVQGVSFRYFTRQNAARLGLIGWVRNLTDGSVELIAEGPRAELEELLHLVAEGPPGCAVSGVDSEWSNAEGGFRDFGVRI